MGALLWPAFARCWEQEQRAATPPLVTEPPFPPPGNGVVICLLEAAAGALWLPGGERFKEAPQPPHACLLELGRGTSASGNLTAKAAIG